MSNQWIKGSAKDVQALWEAYDYMHENIEKRKEEYIKYIARAVSNAKARGEMKCTVRAPYFGEFELGVDYLGYQKDGCFYWIDSTEKIQGHPHHTVIWLDTKE
jgi:hypothetical protein